MERISLGDTKAWRSTRADSEGNSMEVQLILGATLAGMIGRTSAQEVMKKVRVGQKLYVLGTPKINPKNVNVMDLITHGIRILEEVEIVRPIVLPKEWLDRNPVEINDVEVNSRHFNTIPHRSTVSNVQTQSE